MRKCRLVLAAKILLQWPSGRRYTGVKQQGGAELSICDLISSLHKADGTPTSLPFKLAGDEYEKFNRRIDRLPPAVAATV